MTLSGSTIDNKPMLCIAIPTYNRIAEFYRLVNTICDAAQALSTQQANQIFVLISYNPHVNTPQKINYARSTLKASKLNNIDYVHKKNIGGDLNILYTLMSGSSYSDYVWTIGDDDEITTNSLVHILSYLENNPSCSLLVLNDHKSLKKFGHFEFYSYKSFIQHLIVSRGNALWNTLLSRNIIRSDSISMLDYESIYREILTQESINFFFITAIVIAYSATSSKVNFNVGISSFAALRLELGSSNLNLHLLSDINKVYKVYHEYLHSAKLIDLPAWCIPRVTLLSAISAYTYFLVIKLTKYLLGFLRTNIQP